MRCLTSKFLLPCLLLAALCVPLVMAGQETEVEASSESPERIRKIAAVGASATDGFGITVMRESAFGLIPSGWSLAKSIRASSDNSVVMSDLGSGLFFLTPHRFGESFMQRAIRANPDLLLAVDFLFWFSYGTIGVDNSIMKTPGERMKMLEVGLDLLDQYDGPIIVGNIPDMSQAIGRMLSRNQVPGPRTLEKLNARIQTWVDERPRAHLFPLAGLMEQLKTGTPFSIGDQTWTTENLEKVLQRDRLHPTIEGQVALIQQLDQVFELTELVEIRPELETDRDLLLDMIRKQAKPIKPTAASAGEQSP